jgi:hypothetical protein
VYEQKGMLKLTVAFPNFANAPTTLYSIRNKGVGARTEPAEGIKPKM